MPIPAAAMMPSPHTPDRPPVGAGFTRSNVTAQGQPAVQIAPGGPGFRLGWAPSTNGNG